MGRIQIQQDFLSAVLDKCLQPATLLKAPALAQVFLNNVTTDLTVGNILAFAQLAIGMDPESDVKFSTMPYTGVMYDRASLVLPVEKELLEILNSGMNPYVDQIQSSDLQLMYKKERRGYRGHHRHPAGLQHGLRRVLQLLLGDTDYPGDREA